MVEWVLAIAGKPKFAADQAGEVGRMSEACIVGAQSMRVAMRQYHQIAFFKQHGMPQHFGFDLALAGTDEVKQAAVITRLFKEPRAATVQFGDDIDTDRRLVQQRLQCGLDEHALRSTCGEARIDFDVHAAVLQWGLNNQEFARTRIKVTQDHRRNTCTGRRSYLGIIAGPQQTGVHPAMQQGCHTRHGVVFALVLHQAFT